MFLVTIKSCNANVCVLSCRERVVASRARSLLPETDGVLLGRRRFGTTDSLAATFRDARIYPLNEITRL